MSDRKYIRQHIPTWVERCDIHNGIVSDSMIQARMQEEIDDLRVALDDAKRRLNMISKYAIQNLGMVI